MRVSDKFATSTHDDHEMQPVNSPSGDYDPAFNFDALLTNIFLSRWTKVTTGSQMFSSACYVLFLFRVEKGSLVFDLPPNLCH